MSIKDMPSPEEMVSKSIPELKSYAKKNDIDLTGSSTKQEILEVILSFYPRKDGDSKYDNLDDSSTKTKEKKGITEIPKNKIALFSGKNLHWEEVGVLSKGFNVVEKEAADKWLTRRDVRTATPQELAKHYGKKINGSS